VAAYVPVPPGQNPSLQRRDAIASVVPTFAAAAAFLLLHDVVVHPNPAMAFEGGVGGLGKTKPVTGVVLRDGSVPIQNSDGIVSAELISGATGNPMYVQFQTPWPLLATTSGLEARDLLNAESAFVQVIPNVKQEGTSDKALRALIIDSVFSSKGKYGAYGEPIDIKMKKFNDDGLMTVDFTTYTPAMRESERKLYIKALFVEDSLVMLVTGTTLQRFKYQDKTLRQVADSFVAIAAPKSGLKRSLNR
jgi:hypothetical protein